MTEATRPITPNSHRILLEDLEVAADIGFHDFEVGTPQRLSITVDVRIDMDSWPHDDCVADAWNYDHVRSAIRECVAQKRYNLQETLAREIFDLIAARPGVAGITVHTRKLDIYPDARAVGVILSS